MTRQTKKYINHGVSFLPLYKLLLLRMLGSCPAFSRCPPTVCCFLLCLQFVHLQIWLLSVFIHTSIRTPHPSLSQPTSQSVSQSPIYSPICMHIHACRLFGRWEEATQAAKALFDQRQTRTVARGALAVTPPPTTMRTCMDIYPHTRRRRKHR